MSATIIDAQGTKCHDCHHHCNPHHTPVYHLLCGAIRILLELITRLICPWKLFIWLRLVQKFTQRFPTVFDFPIQISSPLICVSFSIESSLLKVCHNDYKKKFPEVKYFVLIFTKRQFLNTMQTTYCLHKQGLRDKFVEDIKIAGSRNTPENPFTQGANSNP